MSARAWIDCSWVAGVGSGAVEAMQLARSEPDPTDEIVHRARPGSPWVFAASAQHKALGCAEESECCV